MPLNFAMTALMLLWLAACSWPSFEAPAGSAVKTAAYPGLLTVDQLKAQMQAGQPKAQDKDIAAPSASAGQAEQERAKRLKARADRLRRKNAEGADDGS